MALLILLGIYLVGGFVALGIGLKDISPSRTAGAFILRVAGAAAVVVFWLPLAAFGIGKALAEISNISLPCEKCDQSFRSTDALTLHHLLMHQDDVFLGLFYTSDLLERLTELVPPDEGCHHAIMLGRYGRFAGHLFVQLTTNGAFETVILKKADYIQPASHLADKIAARIKVGGASQVEVANDTRR